MPAALKIPSLNAPFYILLSLIFLLPIPLGANRPWAWSIFELAIFLLCMYTSFKLREQRLLGLSPYIKMLGLWLAFLGFAALQLIPMSLTWLEVLSPNAAALHQSTGADTAYLSTDIGQSHINFIKVLSLFCLLILCCQLINSEQRIKLLLLAMLASGTFQALYGSLEILLGLERSPVFGFEVDNRASGSFVYHNHYANFLMLCLAAGVGLIVTTLEKDKWAAPKQRLRSIATNLLGSKTLIRICLAIMVIGLVMSRSRMGNVAFFISVAVVGALALVLIRNRSKGLLIFVISMFIIDLFIVSAYFGLEQVKERLTQTSLSMETRDEVVKDALIIIKDYPWFGSGGGSFYSIFPSYQTHDVFDFYDHAHNDYLQFVIEYGIPATCVLGLVLIFSFYKACRAMRKRRNSIFKGAAFGICVALIGMVIHMSVDFPLQAYANACYFVIFIALSMIINSLKLSRRSRSKQNYLKD